MGSVDAFLAVLVVASHSLYNFTGARMSYIDAAADTFPKLASNGQTV